MSRAPLPPTLFGSMDGCPEEGATPSRSHVADFESDPRKAIWEKEMSEKEGKETSGPATLQNPQAQQQTEVVVDDSGTLPSYSNFCRVTATPEEVILDFGLNPQPFATGRQDVKANQRIVMNFYTAKRLLTALGMTIQRHEGTFGSIELDVRRRASSPRRRRTRARAGSAPRALSNNVGHDPFRRLFGGSNEASRRREACIRQLSTARMARSKSRFGQCRPGFWKNLDIT